MENQEQVVIDPKKARQEGAKKETARAFVTGEVTEEEDQEQEAK